MLQMVRLKLSLNLTDRWQQANPETHKFTWEGSTGPERRKIFLRIDQIYVSLKVWHSTNKYRMLNCNLSDHNRVSVMIRDTSMPAVGMGEKKLNLKIINHKIFKEEAL